MDAATAKLLDTIITDAKQRVHDYRMAIDDDKMKILRIEADIQRNEGIIEGIMDMVDNLKPYTED